MITIRPYEESDWAAICRVHDHARPDELRGSCDGRAFAPLAEDGTAGDIHHARKWVACDEGEVVGFVGVVVDYLSWLYVAPSHYGQGIGRRLLRLALSELGPTAWTIVLAGNDSALRLYQSEGFRVVEHFAATIAGYPCACVYLALDPAPPHAGA